MGAMSERSSNSTAFAVKMAYDAKTLVDLVHDLQKTIDDYGAVN